MLFLEPILAIPLMALTVLLVSGAAVLLVRSRKKKKLRPSRAEKMLLRGLDAHTGHADEVAEPLKGEWPQREEGDGLTPQQRLKGSVLRYEGPADPVWEDDEDKGDKKS